MHKTFFLFLLLAFLFSGCYKVNKDVVKKPANLIPKEKMADILTDMEIIQGAMTYNRTRYPEYVNIEKSYYQVLFQHYHVTREQVKASFNYYNSRGDEMARIYDLVLEKLAVKQSILNMKQKLLEEKRYHVVNLSQQFPFLYRENSLHTFCYNPL